MSQLIVLTGASGFIAKHIALALLRQGYQVRGTVRSAKRADEVRAAVRPHLDDPAVADSHLSFAELDLTQDQGWAEALEGADALLHTASPFPLVQPENEDEVIGPAVDGTLRALRAAKAAGVDRVVLTSSVVAVAEKSRPASGDVFTEDDWSDVDDPQINPYGKSKTLAEKAAWDFVKDEAPEMALTVINPGFVIGPALDANYGTSLQVIERIVRSKDPMLPNFGFTCVDVRDIADMHVKALSVPESAGKRFIGAAGFMWFPDMARAIDAGLPERKITTRRAPNFVIRMLGLFDKEIKTIVPLLDVRKKVSGERARRELGIEFRPVDQAAVDAAKSVIAHKGL